MCSNICVKKKKKKKEKSKGFYKKGIFLKQGRKPSH